MEWEISLEDASAAGSEMRSSTPPLLEGEVLCSCVSLLTRALKLTRTPRTASRVVSRRVVGWCGVLVDCPSLSDSDSDSA